MNSNLKKQIATEFKRKTTLTARFGDGWVNIMNSKGIHCEFYTCLDKDQPIDYLTAVYTLNGQETELDFEIPQDLSVFVATCQQILKGENK